MLLLILQLVITVLLRSQMPPPNEALLPVISQLVRNTWLTALLELIYRPPPVVLVWLSRMMQLLRVTKPSI